MVICMRLPATEDTLRLISMIFQRDHIKKYCDDLLLSPYGCYRFFGQVMNGYWRLYGGFAVGDGPARFLGFSFCAIDGENLDTHACWDRHVPALNCTVLSMREALKEAGGGIKYVSANIPDFNRAAQRLVRKLGYRDCGLREDRMFNKNGKRIPCREFRVETGGIVWDSLEQ